MAIVEVLLPSAIKVPKNSNKDEWRELINAQLETCVKRTCGPGKNSIFPYQPDYIEVAADGTAKLVSGANQLPLTEERTYIVTDHPEHADALLLWGVILNVNSP